MGYVLTPEQCQPAMKNAILHVLKSMKSTHRSNRSDIIDAFEATFKVKVYGSLTYDWDKIEFRNQEHFMEWYLTWG